MHKKSSIIIGLIIFLGLVTYPFWSNMGRETKFAAPVPPSGYKECVESREFMRANHMKLLDHWRDEAIRESKHVYVNSKGVKFTKSFSKTCLNCHSNHEQFCDRCHESVGVHIYCLDCHNSAPPGDVSPYYTEHPKMLQSQEVGQKDKTLIEKGMDAAKGVMHQ